MLNDIKAMLDIEAGDTSLDAKINIIVKNATARLTALLGGIEPPEELDYIITEVAVKRFNRIGSEGLSIHTVEGESMSFTESDYDEFADDIQAFLDSQKEVSRGKVRFL